MSRTDLRIGQSEAKLHEESFGEVPKCSALQNHCQKLPNHRKLLKIDKHLKNARLMRGRREVDARSTRGVDVEVDVDVDVDVELY